MARYAYDRLTALDNSFLLLEGPNTFMHVASTALYESGPLRTEQGGIDMAHIKRGIASILHRIPRYRQKLAWVPIEQSPVWIDDANFNLDYHVRHTSLPKPGDSDQLKRLASRIMAQRLDRTRPMWEMWFIEGLQDDKFAVVSKTHHCMIDGASGVDLMNVLMQGSPEFEILDAPPFVPRPAPSGTELFQDEMLRRLSLPLDLVRGVRNLWQEVGEQRRDVLNRLRAAATTLGTTLRPVSSTPLNRQIGPHRRFDWHTMELAEVKRVRRHLGGSVNDVVLTIVTGAVRRFLEYRRVDPTDLEFRVMAPVSVRAEGEKGQLGNRVSAWILPLPLDTDNPKEQLARISEATQELKDSKSAVGAEALTQVAEWTPATLLSLGARNASRLLPFNLVVTNVPGPQVPLYMMGAPMNEIFPQVPLVDRTGLGIALFSYDGKLCWGFNADYEVVPDLSRFIAFLRESQEELLKLAEGPIELRPEAREEAPSNEAGSVDAT
ncbi:MAG: wax ester/triacylglycerol synthase family O-acyltransferase [bacterium]|nr:wax ester/triacylglycerol synthase family O-acyltransferase [bacterium]